MNPYFTYFSNLAGSNLQSGFLQGYPVTTTSQPYVSYPQATYVEREHKIEVPVIEKGDRGGVFLKDEKGALVHFETERLYKALGLEW